MAKSLGRKAPTGSRPTKNVTGITGPTPDASRTPQAVKTRRGAAHTPMHSDTPSGKGQRRHY